MQAWIYSVVGVILLSTMLDIIIAEGETKKYVKSIASLIVIAVIISPLGNLLNSNYSADDFFNIKDSFVQVDENFVNTVYDNSAKRLEENLQSALFDKGFEGVIVRVILERKNSTTIIKNITCNLTFLVINKKGENIDINKQIKDTIIDKTGVAEEIIIIYASG